METRFLDPGALNHRLILQSSLEEPDGCGGLTTTWQAVGSVWGAIEPINPTSGVVAQQQHETAHANIIIRFRSDVKNGWRFVLGARVFDITNAHDPDERRRYLVCHVEEEGR